MSKFTEIVFILDRSGSMHGLEEDTIGGYNALLEKQKIEEGKALVSTILFNGEIKVLHDRKDIKKVPLLSKKDFEPSGCTAMLDAIGRSIHHIGTIHKYARKEDRPEKTLFVITTDGMENASREYSYDRIKMMIERQKKRYGWEFLFLGANIDAKEVGERFGVEKDRSVSYINDAKGVSTFYHNIAKTISNLRSTGTIEEDWAEAIEADFNSRSE